MGCVCECSKDREKQKDNYASEKIRRLTQALSCSYRVGATISKSEDSSLVQAEYLGTRKQCFMVVVKKAKGRMLLQQKRKLRTEFERQIKLDHPSILKFYEIVQDDSYFYLVTEPFAGGQLVEYLSDHRFRSEAFVSKMMTQVFSAMDYCMHRGVIHGNMSLEALVLSEAPENSCPKVKLTGFGEFDMFTCEMLNVPHRTKFHAPEISQGFNDRCDVWSCGALICYLFCGEMPIVDPSYSPTSKQKDVSFVILPEKLKKNSRELQDLLHFMLHSDTEQRLTPAQCIDHPWVKQYVSRPSVKLSYLNTYLINLKKARQRTPLHHSVAKFILSRVIKDKEMEAISEQFAALDRDGDGVISEEELESAFRRIMNEADATQATSRLMRAVKGTAEGQLTYSEFLMSALGEKQLLSTSNLQAAFSCCDISKSGRISLQDLRTFFSQDGSGEKERQWRAVLSQTNRNDDDKIDFAEFVTLITQISSV